MTGPRLSIKAVIVQDGRLLALSATDEEGEWFMLPGGGQHRGESIHEALQRECLEEIGTTVIIHELRFLRDYIGRNHEFSSEDADTHQVELMFRCSLPPGRAPRVGPAPDKYQTGVVWLELHSLTERRLYPRSLKPLVANIGGDAPIYLGDVN